MVRYPWTKNVKPRLGERPDIYSAISRTDSDQDQIHFRKSGPTRYQKYGPPIPGLDHTRVWIFGPKITLVIDGDITWATNNGASVSSA